MSESESIFVHEIASYATSRDYARLAELVKVQSVICIVNYRDRDPAVGMLRDVASTNYSRDPKGREAWHVSARGTGFVWADSVERFIRSCETFEVEFIEPPNATMGDESK